MGGRRATRRWRAAAVLGAVLAAWSVGTPAEASRNRELTVMTQNLYLGSSLQPAIEADTAGEFVAAVATIYGTAVFTNFPARAQVIADEIAAQKPDLIGLQEVSTWTATPLHVGPTPPSFDFLVILQEALAARGLSYEVAAVSENASIGPAPLVAPDFGCNPPSPTTGAFDCVVSLSDRDVILVNTTTPALHWSRAQSGRYEEQATLDIPGPGEESFDRGWASIEVSYRGRDFKFVNTHLEVEDFEAVQEAQAGELLAGPLAGTGNVVLVGDFNSATNGSTTDTYDILTSSGLVDAAPVPGVATCCQNGTLTNLVSQLSTRIDLILTRGAVNGSDPDYLLGAMAPPPQRPGPRWASDHAGVVEDILLLV